MMVVAVLVAERKRWIRLSSGVCNTTIRHWLISSNGPMLIKRITFSLDVHSGSKPQASSCHPYILLHSGSKRLNTITAQWHLLREAVLPGCFLPSYMNILHPVFYGYLSPLFTHLQREIFRNFCWHLNFNGISFPFPHLLNGLFFCLFQV